MNELNRTAALEALPELELLRSPQLRQAVSDTWLEALGMSKWDRLEDAVFNPKCPGVTLIQHVRGVTNIAVKITEVRQTVANEAFDASTVIGGCLLHDVGKLLEFEPSDTGPRKALRGAHMAHWVYGVHLAAKHRIPDPILHIIACHTDQNDLPLATAEAVVVYAADLADANLNRLSCGQPLLT